MTPTRSCASVVDAARTGSCRHHDRQSPGPGRSHYYFRMAVAPDNEKETYYLNASLLGLARRRPDIGLQPFNASPGRDNHTSWIDRPTRAAWPWRRQRCVDLGHRGRSWNRIQPPIAQIYHVTTTIRFPTTCSATAGRPSVSADRSKQAVRCGRAARQLSAQASGPRRRRRKRSRHPGSGRPDACLVQPVRLRQRRGTSRATHERPA